MKKEITIKTIEKFVRLFFCEMSFFVALVYILFASPFEGVTYDIIAAGVAVLIWCYCIAALEKMKEEYGKEENKEKAEGDKKPDSEK